MRLHALLLVVAGLLFHTVTAAAEPVSRPFVDGAWQPIGRGSVKVSDGIVQTEGASAFAGDPAWTNYELRFEARAPETASEAQIWCAVRCFDRDRKYVVGLRGGNNQQLYISRYAPFG